jgi:signal transduction histidine kinase/CheY-like chemotaxis protein
VAVELNEEEVAEITRRHLERQFPKVCEKCGRRYVSLKDYLQRTVHVGAPVSFDAADGDWRPRRPVGTLSMANCACGTTLSLGSDGMSLLTVWRLMGWARRETKRRGVALEALLAGLRERIDRNVLAEEERRQPEPERLEWRQGLARTYLDGTVVAMLAVAVIWIALRSAPRFAPPVGAFACVWSMLLLARAVLPPRSLPSAVPALLFGAAVAMLPSVGLAPGVWLVLLSASALATATCGRRVGAVFVLISCAAVLAFGALVAKHAIPAPPAHLTDATIFSNWVRVDGFLLLTGTLAVVSLGALVERLESAWLEQRAAAARERAANEERTHAEEEQRRAETSARSAEHLEAIGRLAEGVAHDFNNQLLVILSWTDLLADAPDEERREGLAEIRTAASHASQLTRRLLAFAKKDSYQPRSLDLDAAVASLAGSLRRVLRSDIQVEHKRIAVPPVMFDEAALGHVLLNLAVNAGDAMPDGGVLTLSTRLLTSAELPEDVPDPAATYVALRVADTGEGMDAATRARLFEPFFTTKAPGKGTGLGLAGVYGIVTQAGGFIQVESELGRGSTFTLAFPRCDQEKKSPSLAPVGHRSVGRTVLLVEPEESVRRAMATALRSAGLRVVEAPDVEQGLAAARRHRGELDILCTDAVLPGEGVQRLIDGFIELYPRSLVLICSGHGDDLLRARGLGSASVELLRKPFSGDQLVARIDALIGD